MAKPSTRRLGAADADLEELDPEAAARFDAGMSGETLPPPPPAPEGAAPDAPKAADAWPTLDKDQIEICRKLARGMGIYQYGNVGKKVFIFRAVRGFEWKALLQKWREEGDASTVSSQDEDLCRLSVLWPDKINWATLEAGHPAAIAILTRQRSGFPLVTDSGKVTGEMLTVSVLAAPDAVDVAPPPSEEELAEIKESTPTKRLLKASFPDGTYFIVTPLSRQRWTELQGRIREDRTLDIAAEVCGDSIVWPKEPDLDNPLAGYIDQVSDLIMDQSGFGVDPVVIEL